jgi:hypothetical protein
VDAGEDVVRRGLILAGIAALGLAAACGGAPATTTPPPAPATAEPAPPSDLHGRGAVDRGAPRRISGIVTIGHEPVRAHVTLHPTFDTQGSVPGIEVDTGDDGRFDFGEQRIADYVLVASRADAAPTALLLAFTAAQPLEGIEVVLMPCIRRVYGTVDGSDGAPVAGASVHQEPYGPIATTDEAGRYEICVSDGSALLVFAADGRGAVGMQVVTDGEVRRDVTLAPEATIEGTVRDPDGAPMAGAVVFGLSAQELGILVPHSAISDDAGHFAIAGLTRGRVALAGITLTHGSSAVAMDVDSGRRYPRDLHMDRGIRLSGRVTGAGGAPLTKVAVVWRQLALNIDSTLTDADGSFALDGVAAGKLVAEQTIFVRNHEITAIVPAKDGGLEGFELQVKPVPVLRGRVVHDGRPVAGASVCIGGTCPIATLTDGRFEVPRLSASSTLWAYSGPLMAFGEYGNVGGDAGFPEGDVEIDLAYSGAATGVVIDDEDSPVAGVYVTVANASKTDFASATTGPDGSFHLVRLRGGERYDVTVFTSVEKMATFPPGYLATRSNSFDVKDGHSLVTGLTLRVQVEPIAVEP